MTKTARVGALDLQVAPRTVAGGEYAPKFPEARLTEFGKAAQMARGGVKLSCDYDDPTFEISVIVSPATEASVDETVTAFAANELLYLGGDTGEFSTRIASVDVVDNVDLDGATLLTFSGTRSPGWRVAPYQFSLTVTGGMGAAAAPTVGGTLAAELDITAISAGATGMLAVGIQHAPADGYTPHIGTVGTWTGNVPLSTTPATLYAGGSLTVAAHRGLHWGVLAVKHTSTQAGAVKYQFASSIASAVAAAKYPVASGVTNTEEIVNIGQIRIPAAALPLGTDGVVYGAQVVDIQQDTAGSVLVGRGDIQTFKPTVSGLLTALQLHGSSVAAGTGVEAWVFRGDALIGMYGYTGTANDEWVGLNSASPPPVTAGETLRLVTVKGTMFAYHSGGSVYANGELNANATLDLAFRTYIRPAISFSAATPVTATCSQASKTAATSTLSLIPINPGCIIAQQAFSAGHGWRYDPVSRAVYPATATGVEGVAISPFTDGVMELPPGENTFVVRGYVDTITLFGTITEQRLSRG